MTEKELRKLKRSDFLQLLIAQSKEMTAVQARLDEATVVLEQMRSANDRLRSDLSEKDSEIDKLNARLDSKDATIAALRQGIEDMKTIQQLESEKANLNEKDELIEELNARLGNREAVISALRQEIEEMKAVRKSGPENPVPDAASVPAASPASAGTPLDLSGVVEAAKKTADRYLRDIRSVYDDLEAKHRAARAKAQAKKKQKKQKKSPQTEKNRLSSKLRKHRKQ